MTIILGVQINVENRGGNIQIESFSFDVRPNLHFADQFDVRVRVQAKGLAGKIYGIDRIIDRRYLSDHKSLLGELFDDARRQLESYLNCDSHSLKNMARLFE